MRTQLLLISFFSFFLLSVGFVMASPESIGIVPDVDLPYYVDVISLSTQNYFDNYNYINVSFRFNNTDYSIQTMNESAEVNITIPGYWSIQIASFSHPEGWIIFDNLGPKNFTIFPFTITAGNNTTAEYVSQEIIFSGGSGGEVHLYPDFDDNIEPICMGGGTGSASLGDIYLSDHFSNFDSWSMNFTFNDTDYYFTGNDTGCYTTDYSGTFEDSIGNSFELFTYCEYFYFERISGVGTVPFTIRVWSDDYGEDYYAYANSYFTFGVPCSDAEPIQFRDIPDFYLGNDSAFVFPVSDYFLHFDRVRVEYDDALTGTTFTKTIRYYDSEWCNSDENDTDFQICVTGMGIGDIQVALYSWGHGVSQTPIYLTAISDAGSFESSFYVSSSFGSQEYSSVGESGLDTSSPFQTLAEVYHRLFPPANRLSDAGKMAYVVVTLLFVNIIVLLLMFKTTGGKNAGMVLITLNIILFFYFLTIHYIPISILIFASLVLIAIAFFKFKGGN